MLIACVQGKVMLQYQSRQPHIVGRNRRALFAELICVRDGSAFSSWSDHAPAITTRLVLTVAACAVPPRSEAFQSLRRS